MRGKLERWKTGTLVAALAVFSNLPPFHLSLFSQSPTWRPDDRVLIADFSRITAVAASPFTLFAATPAGLLVYDRSARRWSPPVSVLDGYPDTPVSVALADAADDAVWLGTASGWARYDARIRQWQTGPLIGGVIDLAIDPRDPVGGIYLRAATGGWSFLPRGALLPFGNRAPPANATRPLDPRAALAQAPHADALRALLLTDPRLRTFQFTSAARTPDQGDVFFGTNGRGVIRIDGATRFDVLEYGLAAPGAASLAPASDGVWVGTVPGPGDRDGVTWIASDLSSTRWVEGSGARGLGFREARRMLARGNRLWIVTERGVARVDPAAQRADLLPLDEAITLAPAPDGVWVGTRRGLFIVTDSGQMVMLGAPGPNAVLSLLPAGDSVWVGTSVGLGLLAPGDRSPRAPVELASAPGLNAPIVALARLGDTLVAATPDRVAWRSPAGVWSVARPTADLGLLTTLQADESGIWVGGARGLAYWRIGARAFRARRVPVDLPDGVRDVLVAPPYLWVATGRGVVRFLREAAIDR